MWPLCSGGRGYWGQLPPELKAHLAWMQHPGQFLGLAEAGHQGRGLLQRLQLLAIPQP